MCLNHKQSNLFDLVLKTKKKLPSVLLKKVGIFLHFFNFYGSCKEYQIVHEEGFFMIEC